MVAYIECDSHDSRPIITVITMASRVLLRNNEMGMSLGNFIFMPWRWILIGIEIIHVGVLGGDWGLQSP